MKLRDILNELFLEFAFNNSRDEDRPGNKQIIVFQDDESYDIEGNTHGGLSHAIKHLIAFLHLPLKIKLHLFLHVL